MACIPIFLCSVCVFGYNSCSYRMLFAERIPVKPPVTMQGLYAFIRSVIAPFYLHIACLLLISLFLAIDQSLRPYLIKLLLDSIVAGAPSPALVRHLYFLGALYLFVGACVMSAFRLYDWITIRMMPSLKERVAELLGTHLLGHDYRFYQEQFSGGLGSRFDDVIDGIPELIELFIERFVRNILTIIIAIITMGGVYSGFALAAALWAITFVIGGLIMGNRQRELASRASRARAAVSGNIVDVCANMALVRLFAGRSHEIQRLKELLRSWVFAERKRAWSALSLYMFQGVTFIFFEGISLWLLMRGFTMGVITRGDFSLILSLNVAMAYTLWRIGQDMTRFSRGLGVVMHGLRTIMVPHAMPERIGAHCLVVQKGEIVFDHVSFSHSDGRPLFVDFSLAIPAGQKVGLVGYSGSGKTTLVNLMLRFFDISAGVITIDGQDVAGIMQESVRRSIAFIPQDPTLLHRSLWENIRYGMLDADDAAVIEAARKAHAHEFIVAMPEGYDTLVGERGIKLSGGQRQRIALARAFIKHAPILILDEATSSLDAVTERYIQHSLNELMESRTTLVIAHRLTTLLAMDRILVFDKGVIVEDGTHAELLVRNGLYAGLWRAQICGTLPSQYDGVDDLG